MTQTHPGIPEEQRGTYADWATRRSSTTSSHRNVTAIELMPVHQFLRPPTARSRTAQLLGIQHRRLLRAALQYAATRSAGGAVAEFKSMVKGLHEAGIEVILDVVYNHTARATTSVRP